MRLDELNCGDMLTHKTAPALSGFIRGIDPVGPPRPPGPCIWLDRLGRGVGPWARVGEDELDQYTKGTK